MNENYRESPEDTLILVKLKEICKEIQDSWLHDCDKTEYMTELISILKEILLKDSIEEYFNEDENTLNYFMDQFMKDILYNILIQPIIYGDNGNKKGLEILLNIFKLFLKFHKNIKYSPLFEKIRNIFSNQNSNQFFYRHNYKDEDENNFNYSNFNSEYCSEFEKKIENKFNIGDEVDFLLDNSYSNYHSYNSIDQKAWVRGKIKDIQNDKYIIEYCDNKEKEIYKKELNLFRGGEKTTDWDWRSNLKKYDIVDCYDRSKWYPATVVNVTEEVINGYKKVEYDIAFRLYVEHFKNLEDENDTYDKHIDFWKNDYHPEGDVRTDDEDEKYIGDDDKCNEHIIFYSKKIQKFNTYSAVQQKNINYIQGYNNDENNEMRIMNNKLIDENIIYIDNFYNYEVNGKKNYIIGKNTEFFYYYAVLLKMMENENTFSEFIKILKNEPNTEEIYNIFFILTYCFPYLHKDYFKENCQIIKDSLMNYINNLKEKEMRNLPKDLIEIVSNLLNKINSYNDSPSTESNNKEGSLDLYNEITLTLAIRTLKTSIFDRRLQGIKALNEFIEKNENKKENLKKIIELIKNNNIISEIFGANYHSQIIIKSNEIVKLLLIENELSEEDIKFIWSCTKRGDLEASLTIFKLLSELAPYLKENYIEMLLNNIRTNVDKKNNKDEIELVYKLSIQGENNEKNIELCCDYLCQCLLISEESNIKNNPVFEKLINIIDKNKKYIKNILDICKNNVTNNKKTILSYSIIFEIMDKYSDNSGEIINDYIKDKFLLKLFEDNFNSYIEQAKYLLNKKNICFSDGDIIDKFIIDGFTHLENVKKRMKVFPYLINKYYTDYDFLPFLKNVLIENAVSPNDQLIFYDFVKKYISNNENINIDSIVRKEKIRQELFDLISENKNYDITVEQLKLFSVLFFDINKEKIKLKIKNGEEADNNKEMEYEIIEVENIDDLIGLDKLWNIIFQIKDEKIISVAINIIFQIYKNRYIEKLLEKCNNLIKEENSKPEIIEKCIILLKLIIIESEKNCYFKPKSHLSLLKNCLINLPLRIKGVQIRADEDITKYLLFGNSNINEIKILLSKLYNIPPNYLSISFTVKYLSFLKKNNLTKKDEINETNNNNSLYELIVDKDNNIKSNLYPKEKIVFNKDEMEKAKLKVNGEMNPKLKKIFKDWFVEFTEGKEQMDRAAIAKFIKGVLKSKSEISENDHRVINFLKGYDKDEKGYLREEEFLNFYVTALENGKEKAIWDNLTSMGITEDLRKPDEPLIIDFVEKEKLPRYKLGNDLPFIENIIKNYYKDENNNSCLLEFLSFLTTNENIYNDVLENFFNNKEENKNKNSFVYTALNDINCYVEQNYIFIIIESILQDLEIYLYKKYIQLNDFIMFNNNQYKIISENYEPFDNEDRNENKLNFFKNLLKTENFQIIIKLVINLLKKIVKINNEKDENKKIMNKLIDTCLRGIKIINIIHNLTSDNQKENKNCLQELKDIGIYKLGFCNLSSLFVDINYKKELDNISYLDLTDNLINYLINSLNIEEKLSENLQKECLDLLINLLSSNKQLILEYISKDESKKQVMINLFINYFSKNESKNKSYFIQNINNSINKSKNSENFEYINFLFKIVNSLLDNLINFYFQSEKEKEQKNNGKNIFIPDNNFFNLYNMLYKMESEILKNKIDSTKDNSYVLKIYQLVMKTINSIEQNKKVDIKIFINLLQILKTQIKGNEELKKEILFKEENGNSLYNFLLEKITSKINPKKNEETLIDNDDNPANENGENNKFICLENIKEEVKDTSNEELIEISHEFIFDSFDRTNDPKIISELLKLIDLLKNSIEKNGKDDDSEDNNENQNNISSSNNLSSKNYGHVGLKNLGCICYMNSIIQQMYMVPTFRYAIMSADDGEPPNPESSYHYSIDDDNLLHQLQNMYAYLTYSDQMDYNPKDFCFSYKDLDGNPTNVRAQQDSQEFYNNFCDKIENNLKKTKFKYIISDVFCGKSCSCVICQNCKHISYRFEDSYNLTMEVKNINNLNDSLQKMNEPEIIDDFKCSNCDQKVTINKILFLSKLPNVLVVHLKRFYLDYDTFSTKKINSKFEFPRELNLKQFCGEEITKKFENSENGDNENLEIYQKEDSYYEYILKGINVHIGSADGGHYFSFIDVNREGKNNLLNENAKENWLIFNDSRVSEFDTDTIPKECYGGCMEGYSYENSQNGYLLIYERKKKTPIRILIDEKDINKEEDNIISFNKDNKSKIEKEYDLSRINTDKKDEELYNKIFLDEDKNEYFKYIPFYNIPKYAPRKIYNEIMKDNNKSASTDSGSNTNIIYYKRYKNILLYLINQQKLDINNENYEDDLKELIISISLKEFMKGLNSNQHKLVFKNEEFLNTVTLNDLKKGLNSNSNKSFSDEFKGEINYLFNYILIKLIKPLIKEDTKFHLLKIINRNLNKKEILQKIFYNYNTSDNIINLENSKIVCDIIYELINIFYKKKDKNIYYYEYKFVYSTLLKLIQENINYNNKYEESNSIINIYELIQKLIIKDENICEQFEKDEIMNILLGRLEKENIKIRKIIYDIVIYIIKKLKEYNKKLFDLKENEEEGKLEFREKNEIERFFTKNEDIIKLLFVEKNDLLIMFLLILANDNINFITEYYFRIIIDLYESCDNEQKTNNFLKILCSLAKIKDKYTFVRLYNILGYPNIIIKKIPRNQNEPDIDSNNDEKDNKTVAPRQDWPLFGEKLINGDINRHIYEYININHRDNGFCLFGLLFPREDDLENEDKLNKENINSDNNINDNKIKLNITNEIKKKIIIDLFDNCFGEKNNYYLFKYIYLTPARNLVYKNLYEEMKYFIKEEDKSFSFDNIEQKAEKYIKYIEKEINNTIENAKKEEEYYKEKNYYNNIVSADDNKSEMEELTCLDNNMKTFIGFISDIIPGQIIREEIIQIAETKSLAMYRIQYYTKYFKTEELRKILLNKEDNNNDNVIQKKENNKNEENKEIHEVKEKNKEIEKKDTEKKEEDKKNEDEKEGEKKEIKNITNQKNNNKKEIEKKEENKLEMNKEDKEKEKNNKNNKKEDENKNKKEEIKKELDEKEKEETYNKKKEKIKEKLVNNEEVKDSNKKDIKEETKKEENKQEETKKEKTKADEGKKYEAKADERKTEETKMDETKTDECKNKEINKEETQKEETQKDETKKEEDKGGSTEIEETKNKEIKTDETKKEETKNEEIKTVETKTEEAKTNENKKEEAKTEETKAEETKTEETKKEEAKTEETKKKNEGTNNKEIKAEENKSKETKVEENKKEETKAEETKAEESKKEKAEKIETEIDNSIEKRYKSIKYFDISEKNENSFIYNKNKIPIVLEDKNIKDRNNVKCTLYRYIFTNRESIKKYLRAKFCCSDEISDLIKLNYFMPLNVFDIIEHNNMGNFHNILRIRGDLPFLKRDDINISIDFQESILFK